MAFLQSSEGSDGQHSAAAGAKGYRLLIYMRCCLTGYNFPPGAAHLSHCSRVARLENAVA